MNHKVWLTTFGVIAALVIGGTGFYAFSQYQKYSSALGSWDEKVRTIESLERKVPYPNKENSELLAEKKGDYEKAVNDLYEALQTFQRPLNTELTNTEFQELVRQRVQEFRGYAKENEMALLEDPGEFQLGFDVYAANIPAPELVPLLDYELEAIDRLLRELVDSGAVALETFERDPIPGEESGAQDHESSVVHKYPIRMRIRARHDAFQEFINKMANDKDFFYILRVLKVRNDQQEGPIKLVSEDGTTDLPNFKNPASGEQADYAKLVEWGFPDAGEDELIQAAREQGFEMDKQDARVLMGQEMLNVFMVVDIVRFVSPAEQNAAAKKDEKNNSNSKKR